MLLRKGDRVVFLGDSITEQQLYSNYVESYLASRFPELKLTFFNAGWGGDTAPGGLARLERDVLALKPSVVTLCYGMNDASYTPPTEEIRLRFAQGMKDLVRALKKRRIRIALLTPGFGDVTANPNLKAVDYNRKGLKVLAQEVKALARREALPVYDIHKLMTDVDARGKRARKGFNMAPDGFHPSPPGHLVMAYGLLKSLGVPPRRREIVLDSRRNYVRAPQGGKASVVKESDGSWTLDLSLPELPFHVEGEAHKVLDFLDFQETFNHFLLRVTGLKSGSYYFRLGQERSPAFSAKELARGLDLSRLYSLPPVMAARALHDFTREKVQAYYKAWRQLALRGGPRETGAYDRPSHLAAVRAVPAWDRARENLAREGLKPFRIRLVPAAASGERIGNGDFIGLWSLRGGTSPETWTRVYLSPSKAANNLNEVLGPLQEGYGLAVVDLESAAEQKAELLIGSDDGYAVWLNGQSLESKLDLRRGWAADQNAISLRLRKGTNRLKLQISQFGGNWGFSARFRGLTSDLVARNDARNPGLSR